MSKKKKNKPVPAQVDSDNDYSWESVRKLIKTAFGSLPPPSSDDYIEEEVLECTDGLND